MDRQHVDLGRLAALQAETFGEPGSRTFRLLAETAEGRVSLWLEKEQLVMLGSAVEELLGQIPVSSGTSQESNAPQSFVGELEVKVGSLAVGYDSVRGGFSIEASEFESPFDIQAISLLATRQQFTDLGEQIAEIVTAGRPRCPLCGRPITGGAHFCPESNGHAKVTTD